MASTLCKIFTTIRLALKGMERESKSLAVEDTLREGDRSLEQVVFTSAVPRYFEEKRKKTMEPETSTEQNSPIKSPVSAREMVGVRLFIRK